MEKVKEAVNEVFGPVNPREDMTQERLSELTLAVRKKVEGATSEERRYDSFARLQCSISNDVIGK